MLNSTLKDVIKKSKDIPFDLNKDFIKFKQKLKRCTNVYGKGNVAKKMYKFLVDIKLSSKVLDKKFEIIK